MSLPQISQNDHAYHHSSNFDNSTVHGKYKKERSPNSTLWHRLGNRAVTTDDIKSNTNQPTKKVARIADTQQAPETLLCRPTTKYQECINSSYPHNKSSTLPRPPNIKLNMLQRKDKKVSCKEMRNIFYFVFLLRFLEIWNQLRCKIWKKDTQ